jgi:hypothetical protein
MKKNLFSCLVLCLLFALSGMGQGNPQWIAQPYYSNAGGTTTTNLPTNSASTSYGVSGLKDVWGNQITGPSNMYCDAGGKPLFFLIGGYLFNPHGYLIDTLLDTLAMYTNFSPSPSTIKQKREVATGWADICIVPDPSNCQRYYIFTSADHGPSSTSSFDGCYQPNGITYQYQEVSYKPVYAKIDVSQPTPNAPGGEYGLNLSHNPWPGRTVVDLYSSTSTTANDGSADACSPYPGPVHYAATQLITSGGQSYRYIFMFAMDELKVYKADNGGTLSFVHNYDMSHWTGDESVDQWSHDVLSELEINEDITNDSIKIAMVAATDQLGSKLIFAKFGRTSGVMNTGSVHEICFTTCASDTEQITGVEFSPNGTYVYVTRKPTSFDTHSIDYINFSTHAITGLSTVASYSNAMIEAATDGNLYLGCGGVQIASPNSSPSINTGSYIGGGTINIPEYYNYLGGHGGVNRQVAFMPDQIDNETYGGQFQNTVSCCERYNSYDQFTYNTLLPQSGYSHGSSTNQVWKPNTSSGSYQNNPFTTTLSDSVTIGKELRIAAGYTVTIQNMKLKFSPQATLVVENSYGGLNSAQLILRKCTLKVDSRCESKMWPGVRVWGNNTITRSNTAQGYINIDSTCVIQDAWVGVELGYQQGNEHLYNSGAAPYPTNSGTDSTKAGGGQIFCQKSSFINNQKDIYFGDYPSTTGGLCSVLTNTFTTNAYLIGGSSIPPLYHIQMNNYKPQALIEGNAFSCSTSLTASGYVYSCDGIYMANSNATIDQNGSNVRNTFSNLSYGIYASNTGGNTNTPLVRHSTFTNNEVGTFFGNLVNPEFSNDTVKVRNASGLCIGNGCGTNKSGLYMDGTTGYKVENDYFAQNASGAKHLYGIVVSNSGPHINCIYSNTFTNLYKGSQAQYKNYVPSLASPHNYLGLMYVCNVFTGTLTAADVYVPATSSSSNVGISHTDTAGLYFNHGTQSAGYPSTAGNTFSKTSGGSDFWIETSGAVYGINYIYYCASGSCPGASNHPDNNISAYVTPAAYSIADVNCATDPYSHGLRIDNPVQFMLSQANEFSATADSLKIALNLISPNDSAESYNLTVQLGNALTTKHRLIDEAIHLLMDNNNDSSMTVVHQLMKQKAQDLPARAQLETGIAIQDSAFAAQALGQLAGSERQSNYVKLHTILLQNLSKMPEQIMTDSSVVSQIQAMAFDSSDRKVLLKANLLLAAIGQSNYQPYYIESELNNRNNEFMKQAEKNNLISESSLSSKPNPFKGSTTIKAIVKSKTDNAYVIITDMLGNEVGRYKVQQGENEILFTSSEINQQIFFCTLMIDGAKIKTNKMVLIK